MGGALLVDPGVVLAPEEPVDAARLGRPGVSAGVVARLGADLAGPGATTADALAAVAGVMGAVALFDGERLAALVLGRRMLPPDRLDLGLVGMLLEIDAVQVATAAGAASEGGHPGAAVAAAANALAAEGGRIAAGGLVWCGPLVPPAPLAAGSHARAAFGHLGSVVVRLS